MALGVGILVYGLGEACGPQLAPQSPEATFREVCLAALVVEARSRGTAVTEAMGRYCADPWLPLRVAELVEQAQALGEELAGPPVELRDAGR